MYPERGAKNFRNVFTGGGVIRNFNLLLGEGGVILLGGWGDHAILK